MLHFAARERRLIWAGRNGLEGVFEGDISNWTCDTDDDCVPRYLQNMNIPEFLFAEIESQIMNVLMNSLKIPAEDAHNKQNINR